MEKRWARLFSQFDRVVSPSRFIAQRLAPHGVLTAFALALQPVLGVAALRVERAAADAARLAAELDAAAEIERALTSRSTSCSRRPGR